MPISLASLLSSVRRFSWIPVIVIGFVAVLAPRGASAQADPAVPHTVVADTFRADSGEAVPVDRGTIRVPENRQSEADRDSIDLTYVRFPSSADNPGAPIVYLAGGPGGSATGAAEGDRFPLFMALREVADVIAFDQRGTGASNELPGCRHRWGLPADREVTRAALIAEVRRAARECRAHWDSTGTDLTAYTTAESADDLDALRRALGAEAITLWGISYGTHLGLAMMKRHPDRVERAILAGVEGPDHTAKLPSDQQHLLERLDGMMRADSTLRATMPSLLRSMEQVLTRLETNPVTVSYTQARSGERDTVVVGRFGMQFVSSLLLRGPETMHALPQIYYDAERGDYTGVAPILAQWLRSGRFRAMSTAMDAASGVSPERRRRIDAERHRTLLGDAINVPYLPQAADALGVPDLGSNFRLPVQSDVPTLLISGTLDGRTPPSNAEAVRRGLPNSTHLLIDGAGHGDPLFLSDPRIEDVMLAFLKGETVQDETIRLPLPDFQIREHVDVPLDSLRRLEGTYDVERYGEVTVSAHEDGLTLSFPRYAYVVTPASARTFYEKLDPTDTVHFPNPGAGDAVMVMTVDGTKYPGQRVGE